MAVAQYTNLAAISGDATYRAWAQGIHDCLAGAGLVQTADTGQINLATTPRPPSGGSDVGYEIWRFNDALQATAPIFLRVGYTAVGSTPPANPALDVTVGKGSNGAGAITGVLLPEKLVSRAQPLAANSLTWASHSDGSLGLATSVGVNTTSPFHFMLERTRDDDGTSTSLGILASYIVNGASAVEWFATSYDGSIPAEAATTATPALVRTTAVSLVDGENVAVPIHPIIGYARNPVLGAVIINNTDAGGNVAFPLTMYGQQHTYRSVGFTAIAPRGQTASPVHGLALRYE